jgi:Flp pilus assembly pilin Flp
MHERAHETGATAVEYVILCSLIAGVIIGVVATLGQTVLGFFTQLLTLWQAAT